MASIEELQKRLGALEIEAQQFAETANRQLEANRRYEAAVKDQMAFYNGQLAMLRQLIEEMRANGPESEARTINGDIADSETADAGASD